MAYHHNHIIGGIDVGISADYSGDERESRSGGEDSKLDSNVNPKPIYLLEHLATFTVNKDSGIVYPADGMRRLLQLEKTTGIWSQKMQLCLDYKWVLIMDYETGNVIERFPATLIQEPTAFTSTDAMELYNNILVFIVSGGSSSRSEMHIFQSQGVSAVRLVEDLKNLRSGKMVTHQHEAVQQQQIAQVQFNANITTANSRDEQQLHQSHNQQHQHNLHLRSNMNANDPYGIRSGILDLNLGGGGQNGETDSEHGGCINDETSSTSSDKYERDVTVLNHCFDDIEKFIARLQHAAAASRELERRRRNRKTKKKDPGEGLLTLRTRPPHEKEFIDIFAKFKLSFNLLAKLKAHIHDPNAPELVHFLFTPLALIVEASSDTYYDSQLPACVVNPILTREAINLLINCVTSKETELWRSLGEAWIIPRDQWKEDTGSYHPVFLDGWSPDYLVIDELELPKSPTNISKRRLDAHSQNHSGHGGTGAIIVSGLNGRHLTGPTSGSYNDFDCSAIVLSEKYTMHQGGVGRGDGGETINEHGERIGAPDFSTRSEMSIDSIERSGGEGGLMGYNHGAIKSGGSATENVVSASVMQSIITAGIQNLQTSRIGSSGGVSASGGNGNVGNSSGTLGTKSDLVGGTDDKLLEGWLESLQIAGAKIVLVTYPRTANNDKELSVVRGEYLEILDDTRKWWKARNIRGHIAHVPHTIVTPYSNGDKETNNQCYGHQHNNYKLHHALTGNAKDNIEPQQGVPDTTDWIRNKHIGKKGEFRYF